MSSNLRYAELPSDMRSAIARGRKIETIKAYCSYYDTELRAAKDYVELHWERWKLEMNGTSAPPNPASQGHGDSLPKEALLLKLLNMTTAEDNVALVAIRKANELLASAGWSWEKLLAGKITVVEDPFSRVSEIKKEVDPIYGAPRAPSRPAPPPPPPPKASPRPARPWRAPPPMPTSDPGIGMKWEYDSNHAVWEIVKDLSYRAAPAKISSLPNRYAGHCYCCGTPVDNGAGFIFHPTDFNPSAKHKWETVCTSCNTSGKPILPNRAPKRGFNSASQVDLSSL